MNDLSLPALAKVNLFLEVLEQRTDGFHRLETLFQTIALGDRVVVRRRPGQGIRLACTAAEVPTDERNLVWRAAAAYVAGREADAGLLDITLEKQVPHGAGLGGGSSDAAATLRALAVLLPDWHTQTQQEHLAAQLGSDVPFFLVGGTALGEERGEQLTSLPDAPCMPLTIVMPPVTLPTPQVFRALTAVERGPRQARGRVFFERLLATQDWSQLLHNRLTAAAVRCCPMVGEVLARLAAAGVPHLMSGSGAACFALDHVPAAFFPTDYRVFHTHLSSRAAALALT